MAIIPLMMMTKTKTMMTMITLRCWNKTLEMSLVAVGKKTFNGQLKFLW